MKTVFIIPFAAALLALASTAAVAQERVHTITGVIESVGEGHPPRVASLRIQYRHANDPQDQPPRHVVIAHVGDIEIVRRAGERTDKVAADALKQGQSVEVEYDGAMMLSAPPQINATKVTIVERPKAGGDDNDNNNNEEIEP